MKQTVTLTITSLLTILFTTFHLTHDIVRGVSPGGLSDLPVILVLVVWLYGTLVLWEKGVRPDSLISPVGLAAGRCSDQDWGQS